MTASTARRCQCYGHCGRATGKRRACADPDLTGRCRAEHGAVHPRTEVVNVVTKVDVTPELWAWLCQNCRALFESGLNRTPDPGENPTPLFPDEEVTA